MITAEIFQIYLPALEGHLPAEIIRTFRAFLEFCYIARRSALTEVDLKELQDALARFHQFRTIFISSGVRPEGFSLPRQHSLIHYASLIRLFGAPNAVCSSTTESMHRRAVKGPWRRSSRNEPLGQMLVTNQRLDQLAAARTDFNKRGMLNEMSPLCTFTNFISYGHSNLLILCNVVYIALPTEDITISTTPNESNDLTENPFQTSIPDEDASEDAPIDQDILAEVKLSSRQSMSHRPSISPFFDDV